MKKVIFNIFALALVTLSVVSCTETVNLDLKDAQKILVVEGSITNMNQKHAVKLSYTTNVFSNGKPDYTAESGATVVLLENGSSIDTLKYNSQTQQFETDKIGKIGNTYSIRIKTQSGDSYYSQDEVMKRLAKIDSLWSVYEEPSGFNTEGDYKVKLNASEPAGKGDYYQWKVYFNDKYQGEPGDLALAEDLLVDGNKIENVDLYELDASTFDNFAKENGNDKVFVKVEQMMITRGYYEFLRIMQEQTQRSGGLFAPPPAEIRGNIRKDINKVERAMGYFFTASVDSARTTITKK